MGWPFAYLDEYRAWLGSLDYYRLLIILTPFILIDTPRYVLTKLWFLIVDLVTGQPRDPTFDYCPTVTVILAGHNEAGTVGKTIESVVGTYPKLEIIVVDDGSTDGMAAAVKPYLDQYENIRLFVRAERGGKSSCCNLVLNQASGDILLVIDADSSLEPTAIWEMVQPFKDPTVGAVGGTVRVRNRWRNLITALQAYEYLHTIFLGRQVTSRMGIMGVASGALGAFRKDTILRFGGWDVGPGEDGDITLKTRKLGYKAVFAPYAVCQTDAPETWRGFFKQRRRWNRGLIRYKCRKHVDLANPFTANFRIENLMYMLNIWFFHIAVVLGFWTYVIWMAFHWNQNTRYTLLTTYLCYTGFHAVQAMILMYYSDRRWEDFVTSLVVPITPIYKFCERFVRLVSITEEFFFRRSFDDNYVPPRVRRATVHW